MKKLNVFLIQDKTKDIRWFEQTREAVEMSTFFKVTNNIDWRNTLNSQQGYSNILDAETLMVAGEWIDDKDCCFVISVFNILNKPIFQKDSELRNHLNSYIKTLKLQSLMAEYFCYYPLTKAVGSYIVGKPLTLQHIRSKSRENELVNARAIFCKACRSVLSLTLQEIAWLTNRDYTSVLYLLKKHDDWCSAKNDREFEVLSNKIIGRLYEVQPGKA